MQAMAHGVRFHFDFASRSLAGEDQPRGKRNRAPTFETGMSKSFNLERMRDDGLVLMLMSTLPNLVSKTSTPKQKIENKFLQHKS